MRPTIQSLFRKTERVALFLALACLFLYAVLFYKERILFNDTINGLMDMFRKGHPGVATNRYTSIFGELLPYAAYKLHASLRTVVFLHSVNLILIPIGFALMSLRWFGETRTAWSIVLFYTIQAVQLFYYPVSEFQIGLCCLLFYIGFLAHARRAEERTGPGMFWTMAVLFVPTVIFSHPLSVPVFGAWIVLELSMRFRWQTVGIAALGALSYAVKETFFHATFDDARATGLKNFNELSWAILDAPLAEGYLAVMRADYFLLPPLLLAVSVVALVRLRHRLAAGLLPVIVLGFVFLITVTFKNEPYDYYYEHLYQAATFFLALAAGRYFTSAFNLQFYLPALLLTLFLSLNKMYYGHKPMAKRLQWYEACFRLMDTKAIRKGIIANDRLEIGWGMTANWLTRYESLALSALDHPEKAKTTTVVWSEAAARPVAAQGHSLVHVDLSLIPISDVPKQYFLLDTSHYTILSDSFSHDQLVRLSYPEP